MLVTRLQVSRHLVQKTVITSLGLFQLMSMVKLHRMFIRSMFVRQIIVVVLLLLGKSRNYVITLFLTQLEGALMSFLQLSQHTSVVVMFIGKHTSVAVVGVLKGLGGRSNSLAVLSGEAVFSSLEVRSELLV
jgi:hypothetical protein